MTYRILQSEYVINPTKFTLFQFQFLFLKRSWQLLAMLWITSVQGKIPPTLSMKHCVARGIPQPIASIWRENLLGYLSADTNCSEKWRFSESVARRKLRASRKVNVQGQMSEHIFAPIGFIDLQIFDRFVYWPSNIFCNKLGNIRLGKVHLIWQDGDEDNKLKVWNFSSPPPPFLAVQFF